MSKKLQVLHPGGITIATTPSMAYMAEAAFNELKGLIPKRSINYCKVRYKKFSRGEVLPQIQGNVRTTHVYLFYDFNGDAGHDAFVLLLTLSALQDAGAEKVTVVAPFLHKWWLTPFSLKLLVVVFIIKNLYASISSIEYVVYLTADVYSIDPWHYFYSIINGG